MTDKFWKEYPPEVCIGIVISLAIVIWVAWLFSGCTLASHHDIADGFGRAECGWATTQRSE